MAITECSPAALKAGVRDAYSLAALEPTSQHAFPVGRAFAESLGYPAADLDALSPVAVEAFAGVSNVSITADLPEGAVVLDLGCGAGLDTLIAAGRVGPTGRVHGVDFSASMLERARAGVAAAGAKNVTLHQVDGESLPLADASIDRALVNGIFNLNPARGGLFRELARVVRPGGMVFAAELVLKGPVEKDAPSSLSEWFS